MGTALATILAALSVVSAGYANPSNHIVLVLPTNLPTLARQGDEAMFLHDTQVQIDRGFFSTLRLVFIIFFWEVVAGHDSELWPFE
jgi:hypothetical protein